MNKNIVIFKGVQNGISIILDKNASFEEIQDVLLEKVKNAKSFFEDANISISFNGRDLSENEESKLLEIICNELDFDISFVNGKNSGKSIKESPIDNTELSIVNQILENDHNITKFYQGSLRSGQKLVFNGSVVIIGDVNPGGEVIAEGNVIVLGKLKGVVHAGCKGDKDCFISALHMVPTQLIIGDCLAPFPKNIKRDVIPEYAYVKDNQIFVEQLIK